MAFDEECKELEKPSVESWYNLSHSLDLPHLLQENAAQEDQQYVKLNQLTTLPNTLRPSLSLAGQLIVNSQTTACVRRKVQDDR